jgi:hypothetical protein
MLLVIAVTFLDLLRRTVFRLLAALLLFITHPMAPFCLGVVENAATAASNSDSAFRFRS